LAEPKEDEMSVTMVRQKVKEENLEEGMAAVRDLFATFERVGLEGVRYASTRVEDSSTFVILFELADGVEDPRMEIPEYVKFLEQLKGWVDGPPVIEELEVVGSCDLFGAQREEAAARWWRDRSSPDRGPETPRALFRGPLASSGGGIRTRDLRVMRALEAARWAHGSGQATSQGEER
jgi:hypothetical protein